MITKEEFRFPSRDGHTMLYAARWTPRGQVKALVHLGHDLAGYLGRFERFAELLAENGFVVFGHDMLGHGLSAEYEEDLGYFGSTRGDDYVLADMLMLTRLHQEMYPEKPMILLGMGFGSLLVRRFLFTWPDEVSGSVLLSTSGQRAWKASLGRWFLRVLGLFRKERYRPKRLHATLVKRLNRSYLPHRTRFDYLTRDQAVCKQLEADPYANYVPTGRLFADLNHTLGILAKDENILEMAKNSPILILAGEDAGTSFAESRRLAGLLKQGNIRYVSFKSYPQARHDLLHEKNYEEIQDDILSWLEACVGLLE